MASLKLFGGLASGCTPLLIIFSALISITVASICQDRQYFNTKLQTCTNCTICEGSVVMRPCRYHHDTICQGIMEYLRSADMASNPHRHKHILGERHRGRNHNNASKATAGGGSLHLRNASSEAVAMETMDEPFSNAEALVWDWQAVALTTAVFVCILFFLVMTLYSLHQAKQWRRLKENFDADVEELSARLSLMAASTSNNEKGNFLETPGKGPAIDVNYLNNRCVYLEQLLIVRKDENERPKQNGNVYIEESNGK